MSGFLASMVGATYVAPVVNTAVAFAGTDDFYSATSISTSATDNQKLTFACTFYWDGGNNLQHLANLRLGTSGSEMGFWVWINGGRMQCKMVDGAGSNPTSIYENADNSLTANAYNQCVIYWDTASYTTNSKMITNGASKAFSNEGTSANNWNWGTTAATLKVGEANASQTGFDTDFNGRVAQLYIHNSTTIPTISNYWDTGTSKPKDLGTQGTATGLARPLIYHYGNTSTFPTNNGTGFASYTLTANGTITDATGPTYA
jgi:hypothetical protein